MKHVSISKLVRETGLSRSTIDRALNGRGGVHQRTQRIIEETIQRLSAGGITALPAQAQSARDVDVVIRVGRGLTRQLTAAREMLGFQSMAIHDLYLKNDDEFLEQVRELCRDTSRPLILTAKNDDRLQAELIGARQRGKMIITFISDLHHQDTRDAFVGIANRMAGQTAAFILGNLSKQRKSKAGIVLGDYAFSCHEDREIGFRSNLRANFPNITVADVAKGDDSPEQTHQAVQALLESHPDLSAIYNVGGGNAGLARAITEQGRAGDIHVIAHEANHITSPLVRDGLIDFVIAQNPLDLLKTLMKLIDSDNTAGSNELHLIDFGIYTRFNLPTFGTQWNDG